jgi:hypothetical protein
MPVKVCHRRRERDGQKTRTGSIANTFISSRHRVQGDTYAPGLDQNVGGHACTAARARNMDTHGAAPTE